MIAIRNIVGKIGAALLAVLIGTQAMAVEQPKFASVFRDGAFEVRDYPAQVVAEVTVDGARKEAANEGFRTLAGYIFGGNRRRQSISMTAPVATTPGEKIAMTAPVTQTQNAGVWTIRFTMPSGYTLETLPQPNDPRVQLRTAPPVRLAVLTFSGLAGQSAVAAKTAELQRTLAARSLSAAGSPSLAQYDPPWTPWFLRHNEVMIPVAR